MKRIFLILVIVFMAFASYPQANAATILSWVTAQFFDNNGDPLAGGKIYTYTAGTTTPKTTYTSSTEGTANANPVVLDANGRANIWLDSGPYKIVIKDSTDALIKTIDNVSGDAINTFGSEVVAISSTTSITSAYQNNLIVTSSSPTLNLLTAATAGEGFIVSVQNSDTGTTTIDPDGSELINGDSTMTLKGTDAGVILVSDGTGWYSIVKSEPLVFSNYSDGVVFTSADLLFSSGGTIYLTSAQGIADFGLPQSMQLLTASSGTYTPGDGAVKGIAIACGAGGGGGGADSSSSSSEVGAGGGGGGGAAIGIFTIDGTISYTIGQGGAGGNTSGSNGSAGGTTTFTGVAVATGGSGGSGTGSAATDVIALGAAGGIGTTGTILLEGGDGGNGSNNSVGSSSGGNGGAAPLCGGGGRGGIVAPGETTPAAGNNYGGGGGGAATATTAGVAGAAGANGVIYVIEY